MRLSLIPLLLLQAGQIREVIMMYYLVIDDERYFTVKNDDLYHVDYARTSTEGLAMIHPHYDIIYLDHDLGGTDTISPIVNELCRRAYANPDDSILKCKITVHTANVSVADSMVQTLRRYGFQCHKTQAAKIGLIKVQEKEG